MLFFKLGYKNIKCSPVMNILVILQMSVVIVILISMVSVTVSRFKLYNNFKKEFNSRGYYYYLDRGINPETNTSLRTTEELSGLIGGEKEVFAMYNVWISYKNIEINKTSYDKIIIEKYTPELESGSWFDVNRPKSETVQVVVSQNDLGLKVGDVISFDIAFGGQLKAEVIGVLKENTNVINCLEAANQKNDYRALYSSYSQKIEEKPLFIFYQDELVDKDVVLQLKGSVIVTYPDDISEYTVEKNNEIFKQMMMFKIMPLSEMKDNSLEHIFLQLYNILPVFICVLFLTLVSALSTSALSAKRQLKNYAVYYICGLKWKQCAIVNFWSSFICVGISFVLAAAAALVIKTTGMFGETVIEFGIWQLFGCLVIMALYVVLSLILPLSIIGSSTPNQVLKSC